MLLTDRNLNVDALRNHDGVQIIERADAPTAKQVAVIWVSEQGHAPNVKGWLFFPFILCFIPL